MKKTIYFSCSIFLVFAGFCYGQSEDDIDWKIEKRLGAFTQEDQDLSWLTDSVRPLVYEKLMDQWRNAVGERKREIEERLVEAGHQETIHRLADEIRSNNLGAALEHSATEESIAALMDVVATGSSEEPGFGGGGDVFIFSPRGRAAGIVQTVIMSRSRFPEKTRLWASELNISINAPGIEARRASLTSWWEANKAAIIAKRYSEATWLPPGGGAGAERSPQRTVGGEGNHSEDSSRLPDSSRSENDGDRGKADGAESGSFWFIVGAGMLCLLLCVFAWKRVEKER